MTFQKLNKFRANEWSRIRNKQTDPASKSCTQGKLTRAQNDTTSNSLTTARLENRDDEINGCFSHDLFEHGHSQHLEFETGN